MALTAERLSTTQSLTSDGPLIIAGPCAAESRKMVLKSGQEAKKRDILVVRASLYKPRTRYGENTFTGVGSKGIPWLVELAKTGLVPATEVMMPKHAEQIINAVSREPGLRGRERVLLWLGSRNQNGIFQKEIGNIIRGQPWVSLMIKNPMWESEEHWLGAYEAVLSGGASEDQILLCHRGFDPGDSNRRLNHNRWDNFRNPPDFDMAWQVREKTGRPMLIDPSHMGGSTEKVTYLIRMAVSSSRNGCRFDGLIMEVHPDPDKALTDQNQQLTWKALDEVLKQARDLYNYPPIKSNGIK